MDFMLKVDSKQYINGSIRWVSRNHVFGNEFIVETGGTLSTSVQVGERFVLMTKVVLVSPQIIHESFTYSLGHISTIKY